MTTSQTQMSSSSPSGYQKPSRSFKATRLFILPLSLQIAGRSFQATHAQRLLFSILSYECGQELSSYLHVRLISEFNKLTPAMMCRLFAGVVVDRGKGEYMTVNLSLIVGHIAKTGLGSPRARKLGLVSCRMRSRNHMCCDQRGAWAYGRVRIKRKYICSKINRGRKNIFVDVMSR